MHFYYLDEAGCTGSDLASSEQPVFVLGGISVRDEGWHATQRSMAVAVEAYFESAIPEDFELHAEELLSPSGNGSFANHPRDRRNEFATTLLGLLADRRHDVHLLGVDKAKLSGSVCEIAVPFDSKTPYHLAYDYLITYINWFLKNKLGRSARGMIIIDVKDQFHTDIGRITHGRRYGGPKAHRTNLIVEFTYPVDSRKNPMVQLSDLVVYCAKKFLEIEHGYRDSYPTGAKRFYAECYSPIHDRLQRKDLVDRPGRGMEALNSHLRRVRLKPVGRSKGRYGL